MQRDERRQELLRQLGRRVREIRERRGYSQEGLADACGLHRTYVGSVERGESNVTVLSLDTLATTLDVSLSEIFEGIPERALLHES